MRSTLENLQTKLNSCIRWLKTSKGLIFNRDRDLSFIFFLQKITGLLHNNLLAYKTHFVNSRFTESNTDPRIRVINHKSGCWSYVGYQGGIQEINLIGNHYQQIWVLIFWLYSHLQAEPTDNEIRHYLRILLSAWCVQPGVIEHEFLHATGIYHAQVR